MEFYEVGVNKPIKIKVVIGTEASAFTYIGIDDLSNPDKYITEYAFKTKPNGGWRKLNKGDVVSSRKIRIRTFLDFFDTVDNEAEFKLAIHRAQHNYLVSLTGGNPVLKELIFDMTSSFETKSAIFHSEIQLT